MNKPQKRLKIMQGGRLRPFFKGQILTYNEGAEVYYFEHNGITKRSPFTPEQLEAMHSSLVQPLSADGLTWKEMQDKNCQIYDDIKKEWKNHNGWFSSEYIHLYRLKPQPKYIDVPECVKLHLSPGGIPFIGNDKRSLFISSNDRLPLLARLSNEAPQPHQIDPTPIEAFEEGQIYFKSSAIKLEETSICLIRKYCVYSAKTKRLYYFNEEGYYDINSEIPLDLNYFLKVTPKEL